MATITSVLTYTPTDSNLKGYWLSDGYVTSSACPTNSALVASGIYADCCADDESGGCSFPSACSACNFPTACSNNAAVYNFKYNGTWWSYSCPSGQSCQEMTIFESYTSSTAGWNRTAYWCLSDSAPTAVYRTLEEAEITTITSGTSSTKITSTTSAPTSTTSVPTPTQTHSNIHTNKGAIAGGVVGGVVAAAAILGGLYFIWRRLKVKEMEMAEMNELGAEYREHST